MHLEVEINKEIMDYETQVASGLSGRHLVALIIAMVLSLILFLTVGRLVSPVFMGIIYIPVLVPAWLIGWFNENELAGEQALAMRLRYMLTPKILKLSFPNMYLDCIPLSGNDEEPIEENEKNDEIEKDG